MKTAEEQSACKHEVRSYSYWPTTRWINGRSYPAHACQATCTLCGKSFTEKEEKSLQLAQKVSEAAV